MECDVCLRSLANYAHLCDYNFVYYSSELELTISNK